ncbi:B-box zinc finger protein 22 isoform X1 [Vitis riparia]|uniref:B-box zinc finger protein 22 isoform X1 n=1 Tax=Vitis riparia TaxID=96939 RepID=UPI00155B34BE|nr:B-box zinc finger protein 22 isoform X1 [Vitis riparia]
MKIQCNVCEAAEANVLCCADEAALCWACDEKVHAANKLASKHQRVPLSTSSSQMPKCDICQETVGYFFCLEDRALLCRKCDVSIHTANTYVSAHQRFLLTGVKVGLEPTQPGLSSSMGKSNLVGKHSETESPSASRRGTPMPLTCDYNKTLSIQAGGAGDFVPTKVSFAGGSGSTESIPQWHIDELFGLNEFNQTYGCMDNGTSKVRCQRQLGWCLRSRHHLQPQDYTGLKVLKFHPILLFLCLTYAIHLCKCKMNLPPNVGGNSDLIFSSRSRDGVRHVFMFVLFPEYKGVDFLVCGCPL